jgi:hypothetical protein
MELEQHLQSQAGAVQRLFHADYKQLLEERVRAYEGMTCGGTHLLRCAVV